MPVPGRALPAHRFTTSLMQSAHNAGSDDCGPALIDGGHHPAREQPGIEQA